MGIWFWSPGEMGSLDMFSDGIFVPLRGIVSIPC